MKDDKKKISKDQHFDLMMKTIKENLDEEEQIEGVDKNE